MANNVIRKRKCLFGAIDIDDRTLVPLFFQMFKGDLLINACARFDEILITGYFSNGLVILDMKLWRHLHGRNYFYFGSDKDGLCKVSWYSIF